MRVGIATDHGGFGLKEELVAHLRAAARHDAAAAVAAVKQKISGLARRKP
ncbi:MAG: hypothetical protein ACREXY_21250 [Gammaproteobacteria bacterium]